MNTLDICLENTVLQHFAFNLTLLACSSLGRSFDPRLTKSYGRITWSWNAEGTSFTNQFSTLLPVVVTVYLQGLYMVVKDQLLSLPCALCLLSGNVEKNCVTGGPLIGRQWDISEEVWTAMLGMGWARQHIKRTMTGLGPWRDNVSDEKLGISGPERRKDHLL